MIGVPGDARLCDTQPGCSDHAPPASSTFNATTAPDETGPFAAGSPGASRPATGNRIHDAPAGAPAAAPGAAAAGPAPVAGGFDCCHAASASALTRAPS